MSSPLCTGGPHSGCRGCSLGGKMNQHPPGEKDVENTMAELGTEKTPFLRIFRPEDDREGGYLVKCRTFLPDRPGSLARFAAAIAGAGGNITYFHYDRTIDSSRVVAEMELPDRSGLPALEAAATGDVREEPPVAGSADEVQITSTDGILEIKVRLENRPGTLAAFAGLLAEHRANVLYMLYDEAIDARSALVAMAAGDRPEIDQVMQALNRANYHYRVVYRGVDEEEVQRLIGLKLVEKFFLRLKRLLPASTVEDLRSLVASSSDLERDLVGFSAEAGNHLEAGDVFEKVLTFAARSRAWTGTKFRCRVALLRRLAGGIDLLAFRMPTSENIYLLRDGSELTMIDAGHGVYFPDFKDLLRNEGFDPAGVRRIYVTHPDTDHVGMAGYFEAEFGSRVYLHPESDEVIRNENRAWGATGSLLNLNKYYTRLSSRFTECRFPAAAQHFQLTGSGRLGGFRVIDEFPVGSLRFLVLESHGGHTPGLVFYLNCDEGVLFTSDFLINVPRLQPEEKEQLGIYRYLLTNPNRDSAVYRDETAHLIQLSREIDQQLRQVEKQLLICPGHGTPYPASELP